MAQTCNYSSINRPIHFLLYSLHFNGKWNCSQVLFVCECVCRLDTPIGAKRKGRRRAKSRSRGCRFQRVRHEILPSADSLSSLSFPLLLLLLLLPAETQLLTRLDFRLQSCPTPPFIISSFHHSPQPHRASERASQRLLCLSYAIRINNKTQRWDCARTIRRVTRMCMHRPASARIGDLTIRLQCLSDNGTLDNRSIT